MWDARNKRKDGRKHGVPLRKKSEKDWRLIISFTIGMEGTTERWTELCESPVEVKYILLLMPIFVQYGEDSRKKISYKSKFWRKKTYLLLFYNLTTVSSFIFQERKTMDFSWNHGFSQETKTKVFSTCLKIRFFDCIEHFIPPPAYKPLLTTPMENVQVCCLIIHHWSKKTDWDL